MGICCIRTRKCEVVITYFNINTTPTIYNSDRLRKVLVLCWYCWNCWYCCHFWYCWYFWYCVPFDESNFNSCLRLGDLIKFEKEVPKLLKLDFLKCPYNLLLCLFVWWHCLQLKSCSFFWGYRFDHFAQSLGCWFDEKLGLVHNANIR